MCIYDTTHYSCTGEEIAVIERCPLPTHCIPHIRQVLYRQSVCRLCAIAGLEPEAEVLLERSPRHQRLAVAPESDLLPQRRDDNVASRAFRFKTAADVSRDGSRSFAGTAKGASSGQRMISPMEPILEVSTEDGEAYYDVSDVVALADIAEALPNLDRDFVFLQVDEAHGKITCEKRLTPKRRPTSQY